MGFKPDNAANCFVCIYEYFGLLVSHNLLSLRTICFVLCIARHDEEWPVSTTIWNVQQHDQPEPEQLFHAILRQSKQWQRWTGHIIRLLSPRLLLQAVRRLHHAQPVSTLTFVLKVRQLFLLTTFVLLSLLLILKCHETWCKISFFLQVDFT
jgi:hypothetical protein